MKPLIFISNDDGLEAKGIKELIRFLRPMADLVVVAPSGPRSGSSMSITSAVPVSLQLLSQEEGLKVYSCSGTPVDCVKLALEKVVERKPDLLLSGINHGDNASVNVHYSGTMGVVLEGCMKGIPSIGFSLCDVHADADFTPLKESICQLVSWVLKRGLPHWVCLNVNYPSISTIKGLKFCRMTRGNWISEWTEASHPAGKPYYWLTGSFQNEEETPEDGDLYALSQGYGAVVPIHIDMTAYEALNQLSSEWKEELL